MSPLQQKLMMGMSKFILPVAQGANTQVFLAADADLSGRGGAYYDAMKPAAANPATDDRDLAARLWTVSEKLTGAKITF